MTSLPVTHLSSSLKVAILLDRLGYRTGIPNTPFVKQDRLLQKIAPYLWTLHPGCAFSSFIEAQIMSRGRHLLEVWNSEGDLEVSDCELLIWSQLSDLNRRPTVYKTVALPLS